MNKSFEYVLQQTNDDCGIASIMTILLNYGIKPSREEILEMVSKKRGGYSAYDLIKISEHYDIKASGIKTSIDKIQKFPVIAHTIKNKNMFHFIVIFEINKRKNIIKIMDPEDGLKVITFKEFEKITTNIFLIFDDKKKQRYNDKRFKKEILKLFKDNKKLIIKTFIVSIILVVLSIIFNYYLKIILTYNKFSVILNISLTFMFLAFMKNIIDYVKNKLVLEISIKVDKDITKKVSNHILNLPYKYFVKKRTGELVTIIEDIENFKEIVIKIFVLCLVDFTLILMILFYIYLLNFYTGFLLTILIYLIILITRKYQYIFNDSFIKLKNSKISCSSSLINYFTSIETIKNLNITTKISKILNAKYEESLEYEKKYSEKYYNYNFLKNGLIELFYLLFITLTSFLSIKNSVELLDIVVFSSMFYMLTGLLSNITESISLYKVYQTSTDRILDCLTVKEEVFESTNFSKINEIQFKDIKYQNDENLILDNVNLKVREREKIYITGKSGIGKSTLMKLLLRYFENQKGKILIDNIEINDLPLSFIRENITYIGQNEELFQDSIINNLRLVEEDDSVINKVSKITLLDKMIEDKNISYDYLIEESGYNLSGGERKKIILTRGLLKLKNVLILDEVFNEMSVEEERIILEGIFKNYSDKIIILISHRNSNTDLFDKKYNLKGEGDLIEIK